MQLRHERFGATGKSFPIEPETNGVIERFFRAAGMCLQKT